MLKSRMFLCCLPLTVGAYFIAAVNLLQIVFGCLLAVNLISYLQSDRKMEKLFIYGNFE